MTDKLNIIPSGDSILIIRISDKLSSHQLNSIVDKISSAYISEVEDILILKDHIGSVSYTHLTLPTKRIV